MFIRPSSFSPAFASNQILWRSNPGEMALLDIALIMSIFIPTKSIGIPKFPLEKAKGQK
jgi:hypothetical protein